MGYSGIGKGDGRSLGQPRRTGATQGIGSPPHAASLLAPCTSAQHPALIGVDKHLDDTSTPEFASLLRTDHAGCPPGA